MKSQQNPSALESGYVITRQDGTTDGLGDDIVFVTREEAETVIVDLGWGDFAEVRELTSV